MLSLKSTSELKKRIQNEKQISGKKYGLKYDVVGKTDFEFKDRIIDTKATAYIRRLKSKKGIVDPKWYPKASNVGPKERK